MLLPVQEWVPTYHYTAATAVRGLTSTPYLDITWTSIAIALVS